MASKLYQIAFEIGGKLQGSLGKSVFTAAGQLDKLGKQISSLEKAQGTSNRFRALHKEIDDTKLKLRQAEGALTHMGSAVGPMTAAMAHSFDAATSRVAKLKNELHSQLVEMKGVKASMATSGIRAGSFSADTAKTAASLATAQKAQQRIREREGKKVAAKENLKDAKGKFASSMGNVVAAAAAASPFAIAVKLTADFEDSMVRAGALAKATDEEMAQLTNTARKLGRDTRFSATQAATGMQFLAQSGFKVNEVIAAMPGMLNIAAAGAVDLGTAADVTSNILRGFGMRADESSRLGDVLTNTFSNSSTNLTMLGDTMKYVAPISKSLGVSLEATAAAAGLLGTAGIKGEQAGTSMRAMLLRLAAPTSAGKKKLLAAGFDAKELSQMGAASNALRALKVDTTDAKGNLLPLATILSKLSAKTAKFGTAAKAGMMKAIFGMEAATAATVLVGEAGSGNLQKFTRAVATSGTAAEIAAKQNATLKGQWDNLYGSVEDLAIQVGYTLMPTLKGFVNATVPIINKVTEWLQLHPQLTDVLVLGSAALVTGALAAAALGLAFSGVQVAVAAAKVAFYAMNPEILLAVAAVAGLAYIAYQLYEAWNPIEDWWDNLWDGLYNKMASIVNKITPYLRMLGMDAPDMATGAINSRARYTERVLKDFDSWGQNSTLFELTDRRVRSAAPDEEAPWLTKSPKSGGGAGLSGALEKLQRGSSGKRGGDTITVHHSPNITIPPGTPPDVEAAVKRALASGGDSLQGALKSLFANDRRKAAD